MGEKYYLNDIKITKKETDEYFYDEVTIINKNGIPVQEIKIITGMKPTISVNYKKILEQIEYTQDILDECKKIIRNKDKGSTNKLHMRINTVNDVTYDIMGQLEELKK